MDVSEATRTVGGHLVRIYATDGGSDSSIIHGAIYDVGGWQSVAWGEDGKYFKGMLQNENYDLDLTDWRDQIPWERLRDEIEYVTMGKDRTWYGFRIIPEAREEVWGVTCYEDKVFNLSGVKMPENAPADWREAIAKRPDNL